MDDNNFQTISESHEQNGSMPDIDPSDFTETQHYKDTESPGLTSPDGNEAPQQHIEEQSDQGSTKVLDDFRAKGYDVSAYESDEQLIQDTEARYSQSQQNIREAQARDINQERLQQQQNYLQDNNLPNEKETGSRPEFDPNWANLVEQDNEGRFIVRSEYLGSVDPSIAEKVNNYVQWRQERSNRLIDDPVNAVMEAGLQSEIDNRVNSAISNAMSQSQTKKEANDFIQQNSDVLYVKDNATGQVQSDQSGNPLLTPVGRALNDAHVMLRHQGVYDPKSRHAIAVQMVQNYFTQQQLQNQMNYQQDQPMQQQGDPYKEQYTDQPFSQPTNPLPPGYMPNTPVQPGSNAIGNDGMPEHNSLGSLATALAVHKGFLQPK